MRRARHDALFALGALGLLAVLQNVDVLVLGRHDPASSGSYGAVSVACKSLVLVAFVLAGFLLPEAAITPRGRPSRDDAAGGLAARSSPCRRRC